MHPLLSAGLRRYIRIDGKTPASERQALVNRFQENEDCRVAVLSIRAAGVGLTLTVGRTGAAGGWAC